MSDSQFPSNSPATGGGGGGGSVAAGTPVMFPPPRSGSDSSYANQSLVFKLSQEMILCYPTKFKVSILLQNGASWVMTAGVVLRTLNSSTSAFASANGLSVIDSTPITWGGSATPTLTGGEAMSDDINLALDTLHDYWIVMHFSSTSGIVYTGNLNTVQTSPTPYYGYVSGDHTADTTFPPTLNQEIELWRIIAG